MATANDCSDSRRGGEGAQPGDDRCEVKMAAPATTAVTDGRSRRSRSQPFGVFFGFFSCFRVLADAKSTFFPRYVAGNPGWIIKGEERAHAAKVFCNLRGLTPPGFVSSVPACGRLKKKTKKKNELVANSPPRRRPGPLSAFGHVASLSSLN